MSEFFETVQSCLGVYKKTAIRFWEHMTPQQYASILMTVALIGFIAMRGKSR